MQRPGGAYGAVNMIDIEQRGIDKIIVWGTSRTARGQAEGRSNAISGRRSGFTLRPIMPQP